MKLEINNYKEINKGGLVGSFSVRLLDENDDHFLTLPYNHIMDKIGNKSVVSPSTQAANGNYYADFFPKRELNEAILIELEKTLSKESKKDSKKNKK